MSSSQRKNRQEDALFLQKSSLLSLLCHYPTANLHRFLYRTEHPDIQTQKEEEEATEKRERDTFSYSPGFRFQFSLCMASSGFGYLIPIPRKEKISCALLCCDETGYIQSNPR